MDNDLSIQINGKVLNVRVAVIMKSASGFLFEKSQNGYIFLVGGKIKLGESSLEAAKREIMEELNVSVDELSLVSVIENFFINKGEDVHEICFVYEIPKELELKLPENFVEVLYDAIDNYDVRPKPILDLIKNKDKSFQSIIVK